MKKLAFIAILLVTITGVAQQKERKEKRSNLTTEQMAELMTKKMTLHLDLNEKQQAQVNEVNIEIAAKKKEMRANRKEMAEMDDTEKFEARKAFLDDRIEIKKRMKSILNAEQYEKWEKSMNRKAGKMRQDKKRKGRKGRK